MPLAKCRGAKRRTFMSAENQWQGKKWFCYGTSMTDNSGKDSPFVTGTYSKYLAEYAGLEEHNFGKGGSGIIILRGTQNDRLPVKFDGVTLQSILYNGEEVAHLIHDGTQIFMERMRMVIGWLKQKRPLLQPAG